jgi:hypothetical protein
MRLFGVSLTGDDCEALIDLLHRVGRAADLELARRIDDNLQRRSKLLRLSPDERQLLLDVLDDPRPGPLSELRAALWFDLSDPRD